MPTLNMVSRICPHLVWCQEFLNYLTFPLQNFFQLRVPTLHLLLGAVMDSLFFFFFTFFIFPKSPRSIISNGSDLESFGALYRKFWVVEVDWFIGVPASESTLVFMGFAQFILFLWRFLTLRTPFHSNLGVIRKIMTPTL